MLEGGWVGSKRGRRRTHTGDATRSMIYVLGETDRHYYVPCTTPSFTTCLLAYLPTCLSAYVRCLLAYLPTWLLVSVHVGK